MIVIKDINKWIHTIILIGKAAYSKYSVWTILQKEFIKFCLIRTQENTRRKENSVNRGS